MLRSKHEYYSVFLDTIQTILKTHIVQYAIKTIESGANIIKNKLRKISVIMLVLTVGAGLVGFTKNKLAAHQDDFTEIFENEDIHVGILKEYSENEVLVTMDVEAKDNVTIDSILLPDQSVVLDQKTTFKLKENGEYSSEVRYTKDEEAYTFVFSLNEEQLLPAIDAEEEKTIDEEEIFKKSIEVKSTKTINSIAEFQVELDAANDGDVLALSDAFQEDLQTSTLGVVATIAANDTRNIIIDGGNRVFIPGAGLSKTLFDITNNGNATIVFQNMSVKDTQQQVFYLKGNSVSFKNVHMENIKGSGIRSALTQTLNVESSSFKSSTNTAIADISGSVGHKVIVDDSYFSENISSISGGGVWLSSNAEATITNSTFEGNGTAGGYMGGAVATAPEGRNINLTISKSYFLRNYSVNNIGGAIAIYHLIGGNVVIEDSVFEENESKGATNVSDGGAIAIKNNAASYTGNIRVSGSNFTNNLAGDNGAAMLIEATNEGVTVANVYNNTFVGNLAKSASSTANVGGAIQTYGAPTSVISHNTFYKNINTGSGGGGAIGLSGATSSTSAVAANNIFIDNKGTTSSALKGNVATKLFVSANVANNGNVGYDNGKKFIPDDAVRNELVKVENIFVDFDENGIAIPIEYGKAGSQAKQTNLSAYTPSPRIDEMLRTNDPRTPTGILKDTRGFPREALTAENPYYPNAGAVEIYWTKFVTSTGTWSSRFNVEAEGGIESLAYPGQFYKLGNPPTFDTEGNPVYDKNLTFTRNTLIGPAEHGFTGWLNDKETSDLKDVSEVYTTRKQTYVAQWTQNVFHLDFDLMGGTPVAGHESDFGTQSIHLGENGELGTTPLSAPVKEGYVFDGWYTSDSFLFTSTPVLWDFNTMKVLEDTTLYAKWRIADTYTVNFDTQGGNEIEAILNVKENMLIDEPALPTRAGYQFEGWYTSLDFDVKWVFDTSRVNADIVLYAKWTKDGTTTPPIKPITPTTPPKGEGNPSTGDATNVFASFAIALLMGAVIVRYARKERK